MKKAECRFCNIANKQYYYDEIDKPIATSDDYMAVASIGALVEGWTLIIPKAHQLSMINHYGDEKFEHFSKKVAASLRARYGSLISFEHGSNKEGSITACGTDHAHLHLVPFTETLVPNLIASGLDWESCHSSEIKDKVGTREYLFYADLNSNNWDDPKGYLHLLESPISQFFRKLIAERIGQPEMSNYKEFPFLHNAKHTSQTMLEFVA